MMDLVVDVFRVAGLVSGGLVAYTLVTLGIVAWFGGRLKGLQPHCRAPELVSPQVLETAEEVPLAS